MTTLDSTNFIVSLLMENQETQPQEQTSKFDGIVEALDVKTEIMQAETSIKKVEHSVDISDNYQLKKDYEYTRGNLYTLIDKGQEAVDGILELAQESDQPRAYEVAGQLIKHVGDVADKLVDLQKKVNEIENPGKGKQTEVTNNTMFVGSTAELQKMLKQQKEINKKDTK